LWFLNIELSSYQTYFTDDSWNYIAWKDHMEVVLKDNGLKDFID